MTTASPTRNEGRAIRRLQMLIPTFECEPGCNDCCGPVPFSRWEWAQVADKRKATCLTCPYSEETGCAIYEQRPIMCRLFGTVEDLRCPRGRGPERLLTKEEGRRIAQEYARLVNQR